MSTCPGGAPKPRSALHSLALPAWPRRPSARDTGSSSSRPQPGVRPASSSPDLRTQPPSCSKTASTERSQRTPRRGRSPTRSCGCWRAAQGCAPRRSPGSPRKRGSSSSTGRSSSSRAHTPTSHGHRMSALRRLETAPTVAADVATVHRTVPSGARSGAMLGAASFVATVANYVFLLAAGRFLGDDAYGGLAALLGLLTLILLPTGAVQLAISREIARKVAAGDADGAAVFTRAVLRLGLIATLPLLGVALALAVPAGRLLKIDSTGTVLVAALGLVAAFVLPITLGALLGYQRFRAVAGLYVLPFALRLLLLAVVVAAGFRLGGAVFAAVAGGIATAVIAVVLLRAPLRASAHAARPSLTPFLRYLVPVVCGLIGIAILTNVDLLVVKARFAPEDAGDYAAASAFARVAFFLPATILTVLFPRTAARQARGEETLDILGRALIVTGGFCALLILAYAATAQGLLQTTYGTEFAQGGPLLWPMTVAISLYSLANVLVGFHLSRGESRYAWIVGGAVVVQISLLAFLPLTLRDLIWTNAAVAASLLVAHELLVGASLPAPRAARRH